MTSHIKPLAAQARPVRTEHRIRHDTWMLGWPQRPVGAVNVLVLGAQFGIRPPPCARIHQLEPGSRGTRCAALRDHSARGAGESDWTKCPDGPRATSGGIGYGSVFRPGLLEGQTIMVTGGGSGIGRCVAHELASLVAGGDHRPQAGKVGANRRGDRVDGGNAAVYAFDIRDEGAVRSAVAAILTSTAISTGWSTTPVASSMLAEAIGKKGGSPCSPPI